MDDVVLMEEHHCRKNNNMCTCGHYAVHDTVRVATPKRGSVLTNIIKYKHLHKLLGMSYIIA
jgi:hypothetical protein